MSYRVSLILNYDLRSNFVGRYPGFSNQNSNHSIYNFLEHLSKEHNGKVIFLDFQNKILQFEFADINQAEKFQSELNYWLNPKTELIKTI